MKKVGLTIFLVLLVLSCNHHEVYEQFTAIDGKTWNNADLIQFNVNIEDTVTAHDVLIAVRNTGQYEYSNLYLFITAVAPDGTQTRDTTEIILADEHGKWLGRGSASVYTFFHPFRQNIRFPQRGIYQFYIEQAMWINDLKHITDIGLRVQKADNK